MPGSTNKLVLPNNPSLKEINWHKKQINWGELPPFYHLVASSVGEAEGLLTHGFDNAIKRIIDPGNWNALALETQTAGKDEVLFEQKPRLAVYQIFTERGFEVQAFPFAKDKEIDQFIKNNKFMEFLVWDPGSMKSILRINQLHKFIDFYFQRGDEADKALIIHSHIVVLKTLQFIKKHVNVVKIEGRSIKDYYDDRKNELQNYQDDQALSELQPNLFNSKE